MNNQKIIDNTVLYWGLQGCRGQVRVFGVETAGVLRDNLAPTYRAEACRVLQPLHHGFLTDCCQEDEDSLR